MHPAPISVPLASEASAEGAVSQGGGPLEGFHAELVVEGSMSERLAAPDNADLVVFYGGEEKGVLGPCGCPSRPRGGLARQASYIAASRGSGVPTLVLNGGYWLEDAMSLDGTARADVPILNHWMVKGLERFRPDALNVAYNDMAGITSLGDVSVDLPMVSANVDGAGIRPSMVVEKGEYSIGITGITTPGVTFLETPGFVVTDPVKSGRAVLEALAPKVDLVFLLVYGDPTAAKKLAQMGLVDVVIDTNAHREYYQPFWQDDAFWVRSHVQTMRLGELRLVLGEDGLIAAVDRKIDMDAAIPVDLESEHFVKSAQEEIDAAYEAAFGRKKRTKTP